MKDMIFVDVNDGSGPEKLQVVIRREMKPDNLSFGASVEATGRLRINPNNQAELQADEFTLVGECDSTNGKYPYAAKKCYPEDYVRKYLHFR
jgi:aspartyl/asparaginyl-tRNA synthetase